MLHFQSAGFKLGLLAVLLFATSGFAQKTKELPVTYRDFNAGGDFNTGACMQGGPNSRIAAATLAADHKPVANATSPCPNLNIHSWYHDGSLSNRYCRTLTLTQDLNDTNKYVYKNNIFHPLDDVPGYVPGTSCDDNLGHNFFFTMELHTTFKYRGGEVFNFTGDDDVLVYINNRLALDLGGIHVAFDGQIRLDQMATQLGIRPGNFYNFDFFYNERQLCNSRINISTSIDLLPPPPPGLYVTDQNQNIIPPGDSIVLNQGGASVTLTSMGLSNADVALECTNIATQVKTVKAGDWNWDGAARGNSTTYTINPNTLNEGSYILTLTDSEGVTTNIKVIITCPRPANPVASPRGQEYCGDLSVALSQSEGAEVWWTTDANALFVKALPWRRYTAPIDMDSIGNTVTIRYVAVSAACGVLSDEMTDTYIRDRVENPQANPGRAPWEVYTFWPNLDTLLLTDATADANIFYSWSSRISGYQSSSSGTRLSVPVGTDTIDLYVFASKTGCITSDTVVYHYLRILPQAESPWADPPGQWADVYEFWPDIDSLSLFTNTPAAAIWYTFNSALAPAFTGVLGQDGAAAAFTDIAAFDSTGWTKYNPALKPSLSENDTIFLVATKENYRPSRVRRQGYYKVIPKTPTPYAIPMNQWGGPFEFWPTLDTLHLRDDSSQAAIYYSFGFVAPFDSTNPESGGWIRYAGGNLPSLTDDAQLTLIAWQVGLRVSEQRVLTYKRVIWRAPTPYADPGSNRDWDPLEYWLPFDTVHVYDDSSGAEIYYHFGQSVPAFDSSNSTANGWVKVANGAKLPDSFFIAADTGAMLYLHLYAIVPGLRVSEEGRFFFRRESGPQAPRVDVDWNAEWKGPIENGWRIPYAPKLDSIWVWISGGQTDTVGATIWFTLNWHDTVASPWQQYSRSALRNITQTDTIFFATQARQPGHRNGEIQERRFILTQPKTENVTANPANGNVWPGDTITLDCPRDSAVIHYRFKSEPAGTWHVYTVQIPINNADTLYAYASYSYYENSDTLPFGYTWAQDTVAKPVASPVSGSEVWPSDTIVLTCSTSGATIYYSFDNTWIPYTTPIVIGKADTLRAYATKTSWTPSDTLTAVYIWTPQKAAKPIALPAGGTWQQLLDTIRLSTTTPGASIYYTFDTLPYSSGTWLLYTALRPPSVNESTTLRAITIAPTWANSDIMTETYIIDLPRVATPTANPAGDTFDLPLSGVTLSCATPFAEIYYTTGNDPYAAGTWIRYDQAQPIAVAYTTTVRAIAVHAGYQNSLVMSETYVIRDPFAVGGYYRDRSGDGAIDYAIVILNRKAGDLPASITFVDPFDGSQTRTVNALNLRFLSNDSVTIEALIAVPFEYAGSTHFEEGPFARIEAAGFEPAPAPLADSVGPVVNRVLFFPSNSTSTDRVDTLAIALSEPVGLTGTIPSDLFAYFELASGMQPTQFGQLTSQDIIRTGENSFRVFVHGFEVVPESDSMNLTTAPVPGVKDLHGVVPVAGNRRVMIEWGIKFSITMTGTWNPFVPGVSQIPAPIIQATQGRVPRYGTAVIIASQKPIKSAEWILYDALGNVLAEKQDAILDATKKKGYIVWDGRNMNGRFVGSGTYLMIVTAQDASVDGSPTRNSMKIGVKR